MVEHFLVPPHSESVTVLAGGSTQSSQGFVAFSARSRMLVKLERLEVH